MLQEIARGFETIQNFRPHSSIAANQLGFGNMRFIFVINFLDYSLGLHADRRTVGFLDISMEVCLLYVIPYYTNNFQGLRD